MHVKRLLHGGRVQLEPSPPAQAGQYLLAWSPRERDAPLATPLFPAGLHGEVWLAVSLPGDGLHWQPGDALHVRGPLGKGFRLPANAQRVALAALDTTPAPLLPIIGKGLAQGAAVALFGDLPSEPLPAAVEVRPLSELADEVFWADYLALSLQADILPWLHLHLTVPPHALRRAPIEVLVHAPMPCGGLAECGVCAVEGRHHPILICKHGPVLPLRNVE